MGRSKTSSAAESPKWLELSCTADGEAAETVCELFSRFAGNRVALQQEPVKSGDGVELELSPRATITAYLPAGKVAERAVAELERSLWLLGVLRPVGELQVRPVEESDWAEAWKEHFPVHRVGGRVVIKPSWREYDAKPDDVVVELDPGMAFGTGLHPTTQMMLIELQERLTTDATVLDVGCGSGILAIAAAKLRARRVVAVDVDPVAVRVTRENLKINGVGRQVRVARGSVPQPAKYDLVLMNIFARVLVELAEPLAATLRPGGVAVTSGLIEEHAEAVVAAFAAAGLHELARRQSGDWLALTVARIA
ncbi:MAG: 50S ribosomal protein L11 methyltransferase [Chloroflexi bacterium]|nr:50S ribosomal protein L11 methyltransferase [Chloroflexota bacterium]